MRGAKRMQLNSQLGLQTPTPLEPKLPHNLTIPVLWAEEMAELPLGQAAAFKASVYM
jgi:hypothetical protein